MVVGNSRGREAGFSESTDRNDPWIRQKHSSEGACALDYLGHFNCLFVCVSENIWDQDPESEEPAAFMMSIGLNYNSVPDLSSRTSDTSPNSQCQAYSPQTTKPMPKRRP